MKYILHIPVLLVLGIIAAIFLPLFFYPAIIGGDWPYYYDTYLSDFVLMPPLWSYWFGNGLGGINPLLGLYMFSTLTVIPFVHWIGLPWVIAYKIGWFGLFIALCVISVRRFVSVVFPASGSAFYALATLVYLTNTYALMIFSGGQMGVALSYAVVPLVLSAMIQFLQQPSLRHSVWMALAMALQLILDPRIAYVTALAGLLYLMYVLVAEQWTRRRTMHFFLYGFVSVVLVCALSGFWLVPLVMVGSSGISQLGDLFTLDGARYFSFAHFENAMGLLHPNWPENIFGKTGFMKPLYLFLPVIAFASLLFTTAKTRSRVLFPVLLALLGIFLSKGAQDPFGSVYFWLFEQVPGFAMFRDPTKFYALIAVSYAVLVPFVLLSFKHRTIKTFAPVLFIILWIVLIRESVTGQLPGIFIKRSVPAEYVLHEAFVAAQSDDDFRTLWVPRQSRFSPSDHQHSTMESAPLFDATTSAQLEAAFAAPDIQEQLAYLNIKYIAVPTDPLGELFVTDRVYDDENRLSWITLLDTIPWLHKISEDIAVYETPRHYGKMWLNGAGDISYEYRRPDRYVVHVMTDGPADLYVSEAYHPGWVLQFGDVTLSPAQGPYGIMIYRIPAAGVYIGRLYFSPQRYVIYGMMLSVFTLIAVSTVLFITSRTSSARHV